MLYNMNKDYISLYMYIYILCYIKYYILCHQFLYLTHSKIVQDLLIH